MEPSVGRVFYRAVPDEAIHNHTPGTSPIALVNTPNTGASPPDHANDLCFPGHPEAAAFRVAEGQTSTVTLPGRHGSFEFTGVGEVLDGNGELAANRLATEDPVKVELVKLRSFVGLRIPEADEVPGISATTAKRHWTSARAWLKREVLRDGHAASVSLP